MHGTPSAEPWQNSNRISISYDELQWCQPKQKKSFVFQLQRKSVQLKYN